MKSSIQKKTARNIYKRKVTRIEDVKVINKLRFTKGKQRHQLYCRFLYSSNFLTRYDVLIDLRKGTLEFWNVSSKRLIAIDIFNPKGKLYKIILAQKIRRRLKPLGVKFSIKIQKVRSGKVNS